MGNKSTSKEQPVVNYDWEWIANENGLELYKNKLNGLVAEKRVIELDNRLPLAGEQRIYNYRQNNTDGLVRTYQAESLEAEGDKAMCGCGNKQRLQVFSERIPYRLSQMPQLTFPESLYLLKESLNSYDIVYQKMGPLNINQELISIDTEGKSKVWVNENWALNHPSHEMPRLNSTQRINYSQVAPQYRDESEMVANIVNVIEEKTESGRFPEPFSTNLREKKTFRDAKKYLAYYTTQEFKGYVPNYLAKDSISNSPSSSRPLLLNSSVPPPSIPVGSGLPPVAVQPLNNSSGAHIQTTTTHIETVQQKNYSLNGPEPLASISRPESQSITVQGGVPPPPLAIHSQQQPYMLYSVPTQQFERREQTLVQGSLPRPVSVSAAPPVFEQPQPVSFTAPQVALNHSHSQRKFEYQPFNSLAETEYIKVGESKPVSMPPQTVNVSTPPQHSFKQMVETTTVTTRKEDTPFALYATGGSASIQPLSHEQKPVTYTESWRPSPSINLESDSASKAFVYEMKTNQTVNQPSFTTFTSDFNIKKPWETQYKPPLIQQPLRFDSNTRGSEPQGQPLNIGASFKPQSPHNRLNNMIDEAGLKNEDAAAIRRAIEEGAKEVQA